MRTATPPQPKDAETLSAALFHSDDDDDDLRIEENDETSVDTSRLPADIRASAAAGAVLCDESVGEAHVVGWEFSSHPPLTIAGHEMRPVLCYRPGTDVPPVAPRAMVPPNKLLSVYQQQVDADKEGGGASFDHGIPGLSFKDKLNSKINTE